MAQLDLGSFIIECDGVSLTCNGETLSVADVTVDGAGRAHVRFPTADVSVSLLAEEWQALLGAEVAAEEVAEVAPVVEETAAPAPRRRGRRS
jgi:hypothetical protein